jgi:hypothetical protein
MCCGGPQVIEKNGRPVRTRTADLYRVKLAVSGFTTTYKSAGTAKVRGSRTRHPMLWVELWVGNIRLLGPAELRQPAISLALLC